MPPLLTLATDGFALIGLCWVLSRDIVQLWLTRVLHCFVEHSHVRFNHPGGVYCPGCEWIVLPDPPAAGSDQTARR
jgi:hypothetical protein